MFVFFSNRLGCLGSIVVSLIGTALVILLLRSCNTARMAPGEPPPSAPEAPAPQW
jgi:hypothetical protein